MNTENYYKETPEERHARRHEDDKIQNPERHNPTEKIISREESMSFCPSCIPNWEDRYLHDVKNDRLIRKD